MSKIIIEFRTDRGLLIERLSKRNTFEGFVLNQRITFELKSGKILNYKIVDIHDLLTEVLDNENEAGLWQDYSIFRTIICKEIK